MKPKAAGGAVHAKNRHHSADSAEGERSGAKHGSRLRPDPNHLSTPPIKMPGSREAETAGSDLGFIIVHPSPGCKGEGEISPNLCIMLICYVNRIMSTTATGFSCHAFITLVISAFPPFLVAALSAEHNILIFLISLCKLIPLSSSCVPSCVRRMSFASLPEGPAPRAAASEGPPAEAFPSPRSLPRPDRPPGEGPMVALRSAELRPPLFCREALPPLRPQGSKAAPPP